MTTAGSEDSAIDTSGEHARLIAEYRQKLSSWGWRRVSVRYDSPELVELAIRHNVPTIEWASIAASPKLDDVVERNAIDVNWHKYSEHVGLLDKTRILRFSRFIIWDIAARCMQFSEDLMLQAAEVIDWESMFWHQSVSVSVYRFLIREGLLTDMAFGVACAAQPVDERLYAELPFRPLWGIICKYQQLSMECMEAHAADLDWAEVSECQRLTRAFYRKHHARIRQTANVQANKNRWCRVWLLRGRLAEDVLHTIDDYVPLDTADYH